VHFVVLGYCPNQCKHVSLPHRGEILDAAFLKSGDYQSASNNRSSNLHPVFLCERRNDAIQAQIFDELSVMVGDVPDGNDRDAEFSLVFGPA
jgi:hypothetical protein